MKTANYSKSKRKEENDRRKSESDREKIFPDKEITSGENRVFRYRNSQMLGCFCPCHGCIDNAIHTYAGVQLRRVCAEIMRNQGHPEETGGAKITPAFNLPCEYVLHTVGPIISGDLPTREFHFPRERAAEIAVRTVKENKSEIEVIFNVFKDEDYEIYRKLLCTDKKA